MSAARKPDERTTFDQVLKLVEDLTPDEQEKLIDEMKLQWLRRAINQADESIAQGKVVSQEELDRRLDAIRAEVLQRQRK